MFFRYSVGCLIVVVEKSSEDRANLTLLGKNPLDPTSQGIILQDRPLALTLSVPCVFLTMCSSSPEIHLCFLQNFADKTTDGKIRFSVSFLVSFE